MGCVSSKILMRTGSSKEASHSFPKGSNRLEELLASKSGGDQFLALLCTANTVAKKLKTSSLPNIAQTAPIEITNSISIKIQDTANDDKCQHESDEQANSKSIEAQERCSDTYEAINIESMDSSIDKIEYQKFRGDLHAKSIRTVEEFDAMVERIQLKEVGKEEECDNISSEKGWKRKAMGKELANIEVSSFEFSRIGSLREWLIVGNQVISPESYVTPKFGSFGVPLSENVDNMSKEPMFHPEIVSQLEEDMEKLNVEEDHILKQIVEDG